MRSASLADLDLEKVLEFRDGIPGFPASRRLGLRDLSQDGSLQMLQGLDQEAVPMVVSVPWRRHQIVLTDLRQPLRAALPPART